MVTSRLALVLFFLSSSFSFASETPFFDHLEDLAKANPTTDITSYLKSLPPEWRQKYALVYDTKSIQSASLESPRVIAFDPNYRLIYTFSELPDRGGKKSIEAIETYGGRPLQFIKITFPDKSQNEQVRVERNPRSCVSCHQIDSETRELGFIFEPYPNWPGMYGSSHNSRMYGISQNGTGFLYRPEFEVKSIEDFKNRDFGTEVYSALLNVDKLNYDTLSETNAFLGNALLTHQSHRIQESVIKSLADYAEFQSLIFANRFRVQDSWNQATSPGFNNQRNHYSTTLSQDFYYERPIYNRLYRALNEQSTKRLKRVQDIYARLGTNTDVENIQRTTVFIPKNGEYILRTGTMPSNPMFVAHQFIEWSLSNSSNLRNHMLLDVWKTKHPNTTLTAGLDLGRTWSSLNDGIMDGSFFLASDMKNSLKNCRSLAELTTRIPLAFFRFSSKVLEQNLGMVMIKQEWEDTFIDVSQKWSAEERVKAFKDSGAIGFSERFYANLAK